MRCPSSRSQYVSHGQEPLLDRSRSPTLLIVGIYINDLIQELHDSRIGCHICGQGSNTINYADAMVLLAPSIDAMRQPV